MVDMPFCSAIKKDAASTLLSHPDHFMSNLLVEVLIFLFILMIPSNQKVSG